MEGKVNSSLRSGTTEWCQKAATPQKKQNTPEKKGPPKGPAQRGHQAPALNETIAPFHAKCLFTGRRGV